MEPPYRTTPALRATPPCPRGTGHNLTWIVIVAMMGIGLAWGSWWFGKTSSISPKSSETPVAPVVVTPPIAQAAPVTKPTPPTLRRFTDNYDGTVTDNQSGLVWLKNANCFGYKDWSTTMGLAKRLKDGQCDLRDRSVAGQWRLPSKEEWETLIDKSANPALPSNHPFTGVLSNYYWSSMAYASNASIVWVVNRYGGMYWDAKAIGYYVWPVRGGR